MKFLQFFVFFFLLTIFYCQPIEKHHDDEVTNYGEKASEVVKKTLNQYGKPIAEAIADSGKSYYDMAVNFMNQESTKDSINKGLRDAGGAIYGFGKNCFNSLNMWF